MKRKEIRELILSILAEGTPYGHAGLAGLFSDEMSAKIMADAGEQPSSTNTEKTEELIPYSEDLEDYDIDSQVMRSPMTRIRSIPGDAPNPYVPGETYSDTTRRVTRKADDLMAKSKELAAQQAEKRRQANREFRMNHSGDGTGVMPYSEPASPVEPTQNLEDLFLSSIGSSDEDVSYDEPAETTMFDFDKFMASKGESDSDVEPTLKLDRGSRPGQSLRENDSDLSRGSLYRLKYYGRY